MPDIKTRDVVEGAVSESAMPDVDQQKRLLLKPKGATKGKVGSPEPNVSSMPLGNPVDRGSTGDPSGVVFHHTIKTRETKGGIKVLDKAAVASERMKDAFIRTKDQMENLMDDSESNPSSYAQDKVQYMMEDTSDAAGHAVVAGVKKASDKGREHFRKEREKKRLEKAREQLRQEAKETGNTVKETTHAAEDTVHQTERAAHQVTNTTQKVEHSVGKETGRQVRQTVQRDTTRTVRRSINHAQNRTIKTAEQAEKTIKQTAKSTGKAAVKTAKTTAKTTERTIKTAEQTSRATIKTAEETSRVAIKTSEAAAKATARAAEKAAEAAAKAAELAAQAAKAAAKVAAETARLVARAVMAAIKAIIAAGKALIAAIIAGGWVSVIIIIVVVLLGAALALFGGSGTGNNFQPVSAEVEAYTPYIRVYANEYGIGEYVDLIKAVMMQESGGQGTDPMQCSECGYNTTGGYIQNPMLSIEWGIHTLADGLALAGVESPVDMDHIKLALQGYNYGPGYITWAKSNYGGYDITNAIEFSEMMKAQLNTEVYGDQRYVSHVLRYYPYGRAFLPAGNQLIVGVATSQIGNVGGEPYWRWYGYEERVEWCACFVSWCANACGYIDAGIIPKYAGCDTGVNWFKARNQWVDNQVEPVAGMIIFFDWDNKGNSGPQDGCSDHTGIVEKVENGYVYTIEGNSGDACYERWYPIGHYEILGYGIPAY